MEPVSMQHLFYSDGKVNAFGWILFLGTVGLIIVSIWNSFSSNATAKKMLETYTKKITELEMNIRELRGNQYKATA